MKKKMRGLALLLAILMTASLFPMAAFAVEPVENTAAPLAEEITAEKVQEEPSEEADEPAAEEAAEEITAETPADEEPEATAAAPAAAAAGTPVTVTFLPDAEGTVISVYQNGSPVKPASGNVYVLAPGEYTYNTACPGFVTIVNEALTVTDAPEQTVAVTSMKLPDDILITQDLDGSCQITTLPNTEAEELSSAQDTLLITAPLYGDTVYWQTPAEFAAATMDTLLSAEYGYFVAQTSGGSYDYTGAVACPKGTEFTAPYQYEGKLTQENFNALFLEINAAYKYHDGNPYHGDYVRESLVCGFSAGARGISYDASTGISTVEAMRIIPKYHTSSEQQAAVESAAAALVTQLDLLNPEVSDFDKLKTINSWLVQNVRYAYSDYIGDHATKYHNAYGALVDRRCVCQGYASAFYVLALSAGMDARVITSNSMGHAWNIAAIGDKYYYLDATWDSNRYDKHTEDPSDDGGESIYFLKGMNDWIGGHDAGDEYNDASLAAVFTPADYPVPAESYSGYSITYELNGGSPVIAAQTSSGSALRISATVPVKSGYVFEGWAAKDGDAPIYAPDDSYTRSADLTLYAVWSEAAPAVELITLARHIAGITLLDADAASGYDRNGDGRLDAYDLAAWGILLNRAG